MKGDFCVMSDGVIFNVYSGASVYVGISEDGKSKLIRIDEASTEETSKQEQAVNEEIQAYKEREEELKLQNEEIERQLNSEREQVLQLQEQIRIMDAQYKAEATEHSESMIAISTQKDDSVKKLNELKRKYKEVTEQQERDIQRLEERKIELEKQLKNRKEDEELLDELAEQEEKINNLSSQLATANAIIDGLKKKEDKGGRKIVINITEEDKYDGEIRDYILEILDTALNRNTTAGTRLHDVLNDILANNEYKKLHEEQRKKLEDILLRDDFIESKLTELHELGLYEQSRSKHIKFNYYGDNRYYTSVAKTPSDNRTSKNQISDIVNSMM